MATLIQQAPVIIEDTDQEKSGHFLQNIIKQVRRFWPWIIVSGIFCISLSVLYLKLSSPKYKIYASILVQDDQKGGSIGDAGNLLKDFGLLSGKSNVDNEAEILKSRSLMEQVVLGMQLNISYYKEGSLKQTEIYNESPIKLQFIAYASDSFYTGKKYTFRFNDINSARLELSYGENRQQCKLGDTLQLQEGTAILAPGSGFAHWPVNDPVHIYINTIDATIQKYRAELGVEIPNKQVSVIYLSLTEKIQQKGELVLNALINTYLRANVNDKNRIADSTMQFIDERLKLVSGELTGIEKDIENFKTDNKLTDISVQSRLLLENTSEYNKQLTGQEVQLSVINALEQFLRDNQNNARIVPSSLVMQDANFIAIVNRYNELQLQRDRMLLSLTDSHPNILSTDVQLANLRTELLSSIQSIKSGVAAGINELNKRTMVFKDEINKVPSKERAFLDYSRQQAIKQELYLFLLTKREETAISKSSTIANARVVDAAKSDSSPFKPSKLTIILLGLIAGISLPVGFGVLKDSLNNRVNSMDDISAATQVPVVAEIGHNSTGEIIASDNGSGAIITEQLRSLRTNLQYLLTGKSQNTVLITSSMSGEGKSFLSINIASVFALAGKKVILLEFDLRKPKLTQSLQLEKKGFTNFILDEESNWRNWIQPSKINDNFHFMSSGPLPPNPSELLMLPKVTTLFKELSENYDYVIVDSPPVGMVTDAEILATHASITLYVVRHAFTYKQQIGLIEKFHLKKVLPKMNILLNDVEARKGYGYYGYGYGYGAYHTTVSEKNSNKRKHK